MSETTIIDINGVKLQVDLRHAVRIDTLRIGDRVKVLHKSQYGGMKIFPGTVIGFEPFPSLPTVTIAYIERSWDKAELRFVQLNEQTKDFEVVKSVDDDGCLLDRDEVLAFFDRAIAKHQLEIQALEERKASFLRNFRAYWAPVVAEAASVGEG